jgi:hypothetical protein
MYYMTQRHYVKAYQVGKDTLPSFALEFVKMERAFDGDWIVLDENEEVSIYPNYAFTELYEVVTHG